MSNNAQQNLAQPSFVPASISGISPPSFTVPNPNSYASIKNSQFTNTSSNVVSPGDRWNDTLTKSNASVQSTINSQLPIVIKEFFMRNPSVKTWTDIHLAQTINVKMSKIKIDTTMQRQLDLGWILKLIAGFKQTKVVPIQVYQPDPNVDEYLAWDGQHTLILMWLLATKAFGLNPDNVDLPVNIYSTNLKSEIRDNFISLNSSEGKKQLDSIDIWEQQIFGVRVDKNKNPSWIEVENKQTKIEAQGLFVTAAKFGDDAESGAISRLQEINKFSSEVVSNLSKYLNLSTNSTVPQRSAVEKEIVMMSHFFHLCELCQIPVNDQYILDLYSTMNKLFNADFTPDGPFWSKVTVAYYNWHNIFGQQATARCSKEVNNGMPFLIAQLKKSLFHPVPAGNGKTNFSPLASDLF